MESCFILFNLLNFCLVLNFNDLLRGHLVAVHNFDIELKLFDDLTKDKTGKNMNERSSLLMTEYGLWRDLKISP